MKSGKLLAMVLLCGAAAAQDDGPKEPLNRAALNGDLAAVRLQLARGADANGRDGDGLTPLMRAAWVVRRPHPDEHKGLVSDYDAVVKLLLDQGADVNARDKSGRTALLMAMEGAASEYRVVGADQALAQVLLDHGADVNAQDDAGWSPLLRAVDLWADQPGLIQFLLARRASATARLKDGRTALMLAARLGKDDRLPLLVANGVDVNARDKDGITALMLAATVRWDEQSAAMVKFLISKGADPNATDNQGRTAADLVAQAGRIGRAKLLLDSGTKVADAGLFLLEARNRALARAIQSGGAEEARSLLVEGADPDSRDATGRPALLIAAENEYSAEKVILLLEFRASVNLTDSQGDTALMVAADEYQAETVRVLLDHGANPNATDRNGNTVLMRAAASRRKWKEEEKPLIHLLLEKGADASRKNPHGVTALMLMVDEGSPAASLLLDKGVEVDARDDAGNTALLYAARWFVSGWSRRNGWEMLEKGADVNAANLKGETALILAARQYEPEAAELLLKKGAAINAKTKSGRTALMQAIDGPKEFDNENHLVYSPKIAKLLVEAGADVTSRDASGDTALSLALRHGYEDMAAELRKAGAK